MKHDIGKLVADAFEHTLRTTEDPFSRDIRDSPLAEFFGVTPYTYRESLDRVKINHFGEPIPRIEIVRQNLRALGKPPRPPRLPD